MPTTKSESPLTWENPPARREQRYDWESIAKELKKKPNKWAKIFDNDRASLATTIRIQGLKALPFIKDGETGGFQVRTTNNKRGEPRTCTMFLRYVPEKKEEN